MEPIEPIKNKEDVFEDSFETTSYSNKIKVNKEYLRGIGSDASSNVARDVSVDSALQADAPAGTITVAQGGTGAVTLTGILKGNGTSAMTTVTPLAGTKVYYVADSSGGAVTRKLTFTSGILTSET